jgi:GTP cyclohydrolase I
MFEIDRKLAPEHLDSEHTDIDPQFLPFPMKDVQRKTDSRGIHIDQVGVSGLRYPITVLDRENKAQHTVGRFSFSVDLPHNFKGTHMSRFVEVLNKHHGEITLRTMPEILVELQAKLESERTHIVVEFPYFITKAAPVSGSKALVDLNCAFIAESNGKEQDFLLRVEVPVTSLCPCSKEISDYGAHNQRGFVTITVRTKKDRDGWQFVWIEELVEIAEKSASAPIYALLKRTDERHVTMQAYDNPVFVEDIVRNAAGFLKEDKRIAWFEVRAVNQESIHNHEAFAVVRSH